MKNVCLTLDEDDDLKFWENNFFKLYTYNEYAQDIFNTGKYYHFENILKSEGFQLVSLCEPKRLDKDTRDGMTQMMEGIGEELFNDYLKSKNKSDEKYDHIHKRASLLNLNKGDEEQLTTYKDYIMNKYKLSEHLNVVKLLKSDEYLKDSFDMLKATSLNINLLRYTEYKLILVREFENYMAYPLWKSKA